MSTDNKSRNLFETDIKKAEFSYLKLSSELIIMSGINFKVQCCKPCWFFFASSPSLLLVLSFINTGMEGKDKGYCKFYNGTDIWNLISGANTI